MACALLFVVPLPRSGGDATVALLTFTDSKGGRWRVWNITPDVPRKSDYLEREYRTGWLCFESEDTGERRRLGGVPADWSTMEPRALEDLLRASTVVASRRTPRDSTTHGDATAP